MGIQERFRKTAIKTAFGYIEKDPEKNMLKLLDWVDRLAGEGPDSFEPQREAFRTVLENPDGSMYRLIMDVFQSVDNGVLKAVFENFFLNANIIGWPIQEEMRKKYGCNIPWAILLDPTSACNLRCTGCWAAEYGGRLNLSFDEIDSIIRQGKELGVYIYIYTGGEPLVRKADLIALCEKHADCQFLAFTNATLIDEAFAGEMLRVKNLIPAISLEGFESATDGRRGDGVYRKAVRAMGILKEKRLPFGISACYTSENLDSISSDEFIDQLVEWGAKFIWYFHYMPVGNDAAPALLPGMFLWVMEKLAVFLVVLYTALVCKSLLKASRELAEGHADYRVDTKYMFGDFKEHGENLNCLGLGVSKAVAEKLKSERLKTELITNVSHDIKTPLTSIINYAELIGREAENSAENQKLQEYAEVLLRQSGRLRRLLENLVEASKAVTGSMEVHLEPCEAGVLLSQAVGEYQQRMEEKNLEMRVSQPEEAVRILADGRHLWRVFDNLLSNICKYSQEGSRVYLSLEQREDRVFIIFRNMSKYALDISPDELEERFVRGDKSRHMEGNGLGLSIARSLTELQNGQMEIVVDGDLFKVILTFHIM